MRRRKKSPVAVTIEGVGAPLAKTGRSLAGVHPDAGGPQFDLGWIATLSACEFNTRHVAQMHVDEHELRRVNARHLNGECATRRDSLRD